MDAQSQAMNGKWLWPLRFALLLPAIAILFAAAPRLVSGLVLEAAFPAPAYMQMNLALTKDYYAAVAQILSHAPSSDGGAQLWRAEALLRSGRPAEAEPVAAAALARDPASARGWIVLSETLQKSDPQKSAAALVLSLELAPREYFLMPPQMNAGAPLWRYLPPNAQDRLVEDAQWLIGIEQLRPALRDLLATDGGSALVTRALAGHPDELRALNRSLARERMGLH
jgi:hypothetical protein